MINNMIRKIFVLLVLSSSVFSLSLLSPPNNSYIRAIHIPFEWEQAPDAIRYNLQASTKLSQFEDCVILNINSIDSQNYLVKVIGKGSKERLIPFGKIAKFS